MRGGIAILRIIIFLLLCPVVSCHTQRQRTDRWQENRFSHAQLAYASDSSYRVWHFTSDSLFFFHPDSGLHTRSGKLWSWEYQGNLSLDGQYQDSSAISLQEEEELLRRGSSSGGLVWKLWVLLSALLAVFVWGWKRR